MRPAPYGFVGFEVEAGRFRARCNCGWRSEGHASAEAAGVEADAHRAGRAEDHR